jgi:hypothetical protein
MPLGAPSIASASSAELIRGTSASRRELYLQVGSYVTPALVKSLSSSLSAQRYGIDPAGYYSHQCKPSILNDLLTFRKFASAVYETGLYRS